MFPIPHTAKITSQVGVNVGVKKYHITIYWEKLLLMLNVACTIYSTFFISSLVSEYIALPI